MLTIGVTLTAACGSHDWPSEAGNYGTVTMPLLTTVGSSTYRLDAVFVISGAQGVAKTLATTVDDPVLSTTLPAGAYSAFLQSFALFKEDGTGAFNPVRATVESNTETFAVFADSTTTVNFHFETDGTSGSSGSGGAPAWSSCVHVTQDGDDASALATNGAVPFASVQAAVDFASTHPNATPDVCVAAGADCSATAFYDQGRGDLTLRDGISVFGGYESVSFTRCDSFGTRLFPSSPAGVQFGRDVVSGAVIDGIAIQTPPSDTAAGVTVDGAHGALIRGVLIEDATHDTEHDAGAAHSYGVDVRNGGQAVVEQSTIFLFGGWTEAMGVRAVGATVSIEQATWIRNFGIGLVYAAWLEDSPNSYITDSKLEAPAPSTNGLGTGVVLRGNGAGVQITDNSILASGGDTTVVGVDIDGCEGQAPLVFGNTITAISAINPDQNGASFGVRARRGCPSVIAGNTVLSGAGNGQGAVGVSCDGACTVIDNDVSVESLRTTPGTVNSGIGITCSGCAEISGNTVTGLASVTACGGACEFDSTGISADGEGTVVDSNRVDAGCSGGPVDGPGSVGIRVAGRIRVQNNVISGGHDCPTPTGTSLTAGIVVAGGAADIHSNWIDGGSPASSVCTSTGIRLLGAGASLLRNNILRPGTCGSSFGVDQSSPAAAPAVLTNNAFAWGNATTVLYRMSGEPDATTIQAVSALPGVTTSGNFASSCEFPLPPGSPCVDAGTPEGAPDDDIDGDPRNDGAPDVGPDELDGGA